MCCLVVKRRLKSKDQHVKKKKEEENRDTLELQMWEIFLKKTETETTVLT